MEQLRPFAIRTKRVVGRAVEIEAIKKALADPRKRTHILYFTGPGGIGKTRLLEESERLAPQTLLRSGIIDLYHSESHSIAGLQAAIAQGLDPEKKYFQAYWKARQAFEERRAAGVAAKSLQQEEQEVRRCFLTDYNRLASQYRILLRFDTTELIQHESDPVQQVCKIEMEGVEMQAWLLKTLPLLVNTVVLLAGRPPAPLHVELESQCDKIENLIFQAFDLQGLTLEESLKYFEMLAPLEPQIAEIPDDMRQRTWRYTKGHPIRLSLVIDLVLNGQQIAGLFPPSGGASKSLADQEEIDQKLIGELMRLSSPVRGMLHYLSLARKGLDAGLLHYLVPEWSGTQCQENLENMRRFTFVKTRPGTGQFFLHDELYELFDRFVLSERQEYTATRQKIARYYEEQQHLSQDLERQRALKVSRLYYELQVSPWEAFWRCYVPWDEQAVRAFDQALDMRLRDELLRFLKDNREDPWVTRQLPRDVVDRDAAVRWVRRYLSRGEHQEAAKVGRRILESDQDAFQSHDPLYRGALQTAYAEALSYTGDEEESAVLKILDRAIQALEKWEPEGEQDPRTWWQRRVLGRAYNDRGYLHRQAGRNSAAIREYRKAIGYYRQADIQDEMADTLTNMGFVYARWGRITEAEVALQDAIGIRKRLGQEFALGLSYNSLGLMYAYNDFPLRGERWCAKALGIFTRLEQPRGIGLAQIALGFALRKRAEQWKVGTYTKDEVKEFFTQAIEHLKKAETIFAGEVDEPLRLWETYNEMGSTYCDWGWLLLRQGQNAEAQKKYDLATEYLQKSVDVAEKHGLDLQAADSYDDLSQVYADRQSPEAETEAWVNKVREKIPEEYELTTEGFSQKSDPAEEWWMMLGKLHLGYGVRAMKKAVEQEVSPEEKDRFLDKSVEHYAYAAAYLQKYSPSAPELDRTLKSIRWRLKTVSPERLERLRRQMADFAENHQVNLDRLLNLLDITLGITPLNSKDL